MSAEREYHGLGVAPGIAIGVAYVRETGGLEVPERKLRKVAVPDEEVRLEKAVELARRQIRRLQNRTGDLPGTASEELGFLLDAYQQMLGNSRLVRGAKARIVDERVNAEAAVQREITAITETFQAMDDAYIAARLEDIREVGNRIIRNLTRKPLRAFSTAPMSSSPVAVIFHAFSASSFPPLTTVPVVGFTATALISSPCAFSTVLTIAPDLLFRQ